MTRHLPHVVDGIGAHRLFERKSGTDTWILGSTDLDRYITLPGTVLEPIRHAVLLLDGTRTATEVRDQLREEHAWDLDVESLLVRLRQAGLVRGIDGRVPSMLTDIERVSIPVFRISLGELGQWIERHVPALAAIWFVCLGGIALFGTLALCLLPSPAPVIGRVEVQWVVLGAVASLLFHELSHGLAALREGLRPTQLTGGLYFGYIPMLYLRIPGIYTVSRSARARIWVAGCVFNASVVFAGLAATRLLLPDGEMASWWTTMIAWNLTLLFVNLLPFLPTDGYFLLCTLFKEHNVRGQAWRMTRQWLRGKGQGGQIRQFIMVLYLLGVVGMLTHFLIASLTVARVKAATWGLPFHVLAVAPFAILLVRVFWRRAFTRWRTRSAA